MLQCVKIGDVCFNAVIRSFICSAHQPVWLSCLDHSFIAANSFKSGSQRRLPGSNTGTISTTTTRISTLLSSSSQPFPAPPSSASCALSFHGTALHFAAVGSASTSYASTVSASSLLRSSPFRYHAAASSFSGTSGTYSTTNERDRRHRAKYAWVANRGFEDGIEFYKK